MPGTGDELSILGFGCMRLKRNLGATDMEKAERQVRAAVKAGINYFDTAYMYPGNEKAIGTILAKPDAEGRPLRESVFIATKLPSFLVKTTEDLNRYFQASLDRLAMQYVDYYLIHNLSSLSSWERLKQLGAAEFLEKAKSDGKIGHIGFSWHGNLHDFRKVIDDYAWEFCQIQYNYLDEGFQAGTEGLKYAASKGVGVIIMEPLRGGTLAGKIPHDAKLIMDEHRGEDGNTKTPANWGLRWVWNHPEAVCVLSGMNEVSHVEQNVSAALDTLNGPLTAADINMVERVRDVFQRAIKLNCTGCAYCMPCPYGVDIPFCFSAWNGNAMFPGLSSKVMYNFLLRKTASKSCGLASVCKRCGACEKKCPQGLPIMDSLECVAKDMENPLLRGAMKLAGLFMRN